MKALAFVPAVLVLAACGTSSHATQGTGDNTASATTTAGAAGTAASVATTRSSGAGSLHVKVMRWRLPAPIAREAVSVSGTTATVAGGLLDGDASTGASYTLSLATGHATKLPDLTVPVHDTAGAPGPLVIGGGNASEQDVVQARSGAGWAVVGHLPQPRSDLSVVEVNGRILVLGGYRGTGTAEPSILASTDGNQWQKIGRLPLPVRYAATAVVGSDVYVIGGERAGVEQTAIQRVDATTGKASIIGHLPGPLGHASAVVLGGRILLAGGRTGVDTLTDKLWWLDPASGQVTPAGRLPFPLADSAVATSGGHAYLIGGEVPNDTDKVLRLTFR